MPEAWLMCDNVEDGTQPNRREPNAPVNLDVLADIGVLYWEIDADNYETEGKLARIREERGYSYSDIIEINAEKMGPALYKEKTDMFFKEHIHTDEEIRFFLAGSGYFDVRDKNDNWIRINCGKGDMIVLPAGIYHRFAPAGQHVWLFNCNCMVMRLFVGEPVWTAHNRPVDDMEARVEYVKKFSVSAH